MGKDATKQQLKAEKKKQKAEERKNKAKSATQPSGDAVPTGAVPKQPAAEPDIEQISGAMVEYNADEQEGGSLARRRKMPPGSAASVVTDEQAVGSSITVHEPATKRNKAITTSMAQLFDLFGRLGQARNLHAPSKRLQQPCLVLSMGMQHACR